MKLTTTLLPLTALSSLIPTVAAALHGRVINNCPFPVFAKTSRGGGYDSHELHRIAPHGGQYRAAVPTLNNVPGIAIKLQPHADPAWRDVYQVEYTQSDTPWTRDGTASWAWYDLSTVDGSPFGGVWRRLELRRGSGAGSACKVLECPPGGAGCEWPVPEKGEVGDCRAGKEAEMVFTLCRK